MASKRKQLMVVAVISLATSILSTPQHAKGDDDTYVKIQEMVNDLGGPAHQKANNGKVQKCANGGTKKITIRGGTYQGVYKNCREYGRTRDGEVVISIGGDEAPATKSAKQNTASDFVYWASTGDIDELSRMLKKNRKLANATTTAERDDGSKTYNFSALMAAAQNNHIEIARLLVNSGANVNSLSSGNASALWLAANKGNTEVVEYLLSKGAKKDVQDDYGMSPLMTAAARGYLETVNILIGAKAILDLKHKDGDTALFFAIKHTPIALSLINAGAGLDFMNKFGATPLLLAVDKNNIQVTRRLLEMGAKAGFEEAIRIANKIGDQDMINLLNSFGGVK